MANAHAEVICVSAAAKTSSVVSHREKKQVVDRMAAIVDSKPLRPETLQ
jgi:hypothetical protein